MNKKLNISMLLIVVFCSLLSCACLKKNNNTQTMTFDNNNKSTSQVSNSLDTLNLAKTDTTEIATQAQKEESNHAILQKTTIEELPQDTTEKQPETATKQGEPRKIADKDLVPSENENKSGFSPVVKKSENKDSQPIVPKKPPIIIYKTKANYANNIPIILSEDKQKVVRYPAPSDLFFEGKISRPTPLANNFYLDNRGVNENVAFVSYTYDDYLNLKKTPTAEELFNAVIDNDPLLEIYQLKDLERTPQALNQFIEAGIFPENYAKE